MSQVSDKQISNIKIGDQYCKDISDLQNDNVW